MSSTESKMIAKFGVNVISAGGYTTDLAVLQPLLERHSDWFIKRMGGHRWEVRNGVQDKPFYGKTLCEALCHALLET